MANDYPSDQTYYPRWKMKLGIRFDEMSRRVFTGKLPPKPLKYLSGVKDPLAPLTYRRDTSTPNTRLWVLDYDSSKKIYAGAVVSTSSKGYVSSGPQRQITSSDGLTHVLGAIVPKDFDWKQNGLRSADTFNATLRYVDCPIDPRTVRSTWVEFYLGTITAEEHYLGINGVLRPIGTGSEGVISMSMLPDDWVDDDGVQRTNRRFQGFIDKWDNDWTESGEPIIRIECRDNTQLLIDTEAPAKLRIDAGLPIDQAIVQYLSHFPQFAGLLVDYRPGDTLDGDVPVLRKSLTKAAFPPQLGPQPSLMNGQPTGLSVWDFITDVVGTVGHTVRVEGVTVVIERPRTLFSSDQGSAVRSDDPFKGLNGSTFRQMIWGRNLLEMKTSRSFVKTVPTNIEVRSDCPEKKTTIVGRWPTNITGAGVQTSIPGDGGADEKWLVVKIAGIADVQTARVIAQNYYEQLARQELYVSMKTHNLASFGGGNQDPNLLDLRVGDTVEVLVNRSHPAAKGAPPDAVDGAPTLSRIEQMLIVQRQASSTFMQQLGFAQAFSDAYAKVFTDLGFQQGYRVKTAGFSGSIDPAQVTVTIDAVNYVEVRADPVNMPPLGDGSIGRP